MLIYEGEKKCLFLFQLNNQSVEMQRDLQRYLLERKCEYDLYFENS